MKIIIETIDHSSQAYPTVGNWTWKKEGEEDVLLIQVSKMNNWKYEALVGLHEAVETLICKDKNIEEEDVTAFDLMFEKEREEGKHRDDEECGDDPKAPYKQAHFIATNVERILSDALGVDWKTYDDTVMGL